MSIFGIISGMRKHSGLMDILLHQLARLVQLHFSNILKIRGKMKIAVFIPSAKANGFSTDYSSYKITLFPFESGECGCYTYDEWDFHLIKEDITIQGEHHSCVVFNKKETTEPVNGLGTMEEWDEDGKIKISRKGFIIDGKLQGPGEKIINENRLN